MPDWLEDASANRHIKTYIKDFLDASGNLTVRNNNEEYKWNSYGQLISGVYENNDVHFGIGVGMDVSGLTIVVGSYQEQESNDGAVYVYRYDTTAELWYQLGNRITESGTSDFGRTVDMSDDGTRIIATDTTSNFVNVYDYNSGTNTWDRQVNITAHTLEIYGARISGDGNTIVFNNFRDNSNTGKQYVYRNTSGTTWTQIGEFTGSHVNAYPLVCSLSYHGNRVTFHESNYDYDINGNSLSDIGRVIIYDYSESETTWNQVGDPIYGNYSSDRFGSSGDLSKDGSIVAIGNEPATGEASSIRVFQYDAEVSGSWKQLGTTIHGPNPFSNHFGIGVRLSDDGNTLLANDSTYEEMYIYKYIGSDWVQHGSTIYGSYETAYLGSKHGASISISGDGSKIVAGAYYADVNATNSGYVQAWQWSQKAPHTNPVLDISGGVLTISNGEEHNARGYTVSQLGITLYGEASNDHFGITAEMNKDGSVVAIGAKGVSSGDGAVYVYTYQSGFWQQKGSTISPYSSFSSSQFGFGVDINDDGNVIVTGSTHHYNDNGASVNDAGSLDVFEFTNGDWVQKGRSFKGIAVDDHLGLFSSSINGAGNIIAGLFHMSGFVRVYQYDDDTSDWVQMGGDIPMTPGLTTVAEYWQQRRIDLSEDGTIIALGDVEDDTAGTNTGKITIYKYTVVDNVGSWNKLGDDIVSPTDSTQVRVDAFGGGVSLSSDGHTVAFNSLLWNTLKGLARIFKYSEEGNVWTQLGTDFNPTTVANVGGGTYTARTIGLSGDGKTFIHGQSHNDVNGSGYGAVHVHKYFNGQWNQIHTEYGTAGQYSYFGLNGVSMSRDGTRFVASTGDADVPGTDQGYSRMFEITNPPPIKIDKDGVSLDNLFTGDNVTLQCPTLKGVAGGIANYESFWGRNPGVGDWRSSFGNQNAGYLYIDNAYSSAFDLLLTGFYTVGGGVHRRGQDLASRNGGALNFQHRITQGSTNEDFSLGINTTAYNYRLNVGGAVWINGSYYSSDDRIKHNETPLTNALETIRKLNPRHYIKTLKMYDADHQLELDASGNPLDASGNPMPVSEYIIEDGFIAQEVNEIPELKYAFNESPGEDMPHGLDYTSIFTTAVKALKELDELDGQRQTKLSSLQARIEALENK